IGIFCIKWEKIHDLGGRECFSTRASKRRLTEERRVGGGQAASASRADVLFTGKRSEEEKLKTEASGSEGVPGETPWDAHAGTPPGRRRSASQLGEGLPDINQRLINCFISLKGEHKGRHLLQVKLLSITPPQTLLLEDMVGGHLLQGKSHTAARSIKKHAKSES
uniref:Uncharacterized protein n=1 Tax=Oryzias latipes TaxID=8090 RepID=A0A3P9KZV1_ORYLA